MRALKEAPPPRAGPTRRLAAPSRSRIKKGITFSRFETVPDAPVSSFDLTLPQGPHSVLAANGDLCASKTVTVNKKITRRVKGRTIHTTRKLRRTVTAPLLMPTTMTAQNGAVINQSTKVAVTGCSKAKAVNHAKGSTSRRRGHR
jgi:hypothetical protein